MNHLRAAALVVCLLASTACNDPQFDGIAFEPPREIPTFRFVASTGDTVQLAPEPGRPTMVFFGYTHCPDICPMTLSEWTQAKAALGPDGDRVRWVFVSVDPERDTPAVAEAYAKQFDDTFVGVSGDAATTAAIQAAFGVASYEEPGSSEADYLVAHASQCFLVDDTGQLRVMFSFNSGVDAMVADLRRLLP